MRIVIIIAAVPPGKPRKGIAATIAYSRNEAARRIYPAFFFKSASPIVF